MRASRIIMGLSGPLLGSLLLAWGTPLFAQQNPTHRPSGGTATHHPSGGAMPSPGGGSTFGGASSFGGATHHSAGGAMPSPGAASGSRFGGPSGIGGASSRTFQQQQFRGFPTQAGARQSYSPPHQPQHNQQGYLPLSQFGQQQQQQQQHHQNVQVPTHGTQPPRQPGMQLQPSPGLANQLLHVNTVGGTATTGSTMPARVGGGQIPQGTLTGGAHSRNTTGGMTDPGRSARGTPPTVINGIPVDQLKAGVGAGVANGTTATGKGAAAHQVPPAPNVIGTIPSSYLHTNAGASGRGGGRQHVPQNNVAGGISSSNTIPGASGRGGGDHVPQNNVVGGISSSNTIPGASGRGGGDHVPQIKVPGGNAVSTGGGTTGPGRNALPGRNNALSGTTDPGRAGRNALSGRSNLNAASTGNGRNALPGGNNAVTNATANGGSNRPGNASARNSLPGGGTTASGRGGNAVLGATGNKLAGNMANGQPGTGPRPISARHTARLGKPGGTQSNQGSAGASTLSSSTATGRNGQHTVMRPKPPGTTDLPKSANGTTGTGRTAQGLTATGGTTGNQGQGARSRVQGQVAGGPGQTTAATNNGPKPDPAAAAKLNPRFKRPALGSLASGNAKKPGVKIPDGAGVGATSNLAGTGHPFSFNGIYSDGKGHFPASAPVTPPNQLNVAATNPTQGLSLTGNHSGADSANAMMGEALATMHPYGLNQQGKDDLDAFKQDVQNGASSEQINADYAKLNKDITATADSVEAFTPQLQHLQQQASQVASLASIRDQLEQGPPPQDQPLPTGPATIINNPALPQGQMAVLGDNTVLVGGGGLPIPQGATYFPMGGGVGGNVAMWTGTLADIGVPVQTGYPVPDVDLTAAEVPMDVVPPVVMPPTEVPATFVPAAGGNPVATLPPADVPLPTPVASLPTGGVPVPTPSPIASLPPGGVQVPTPSPAAVVANSLPPAQVPPAPPTQPGSIVIVNPADSGGTVTYSIGGDTFSLEPGFEHEHQVDQAAVVAFDRGEQFGQAQYTLTPESYRFLVTDKGWDLQKMPHSITLDNSDNPNDFNYTMAGEAQVVPAKQSKTITGQAKIRLAFDRGDGGDAAVKELVDGAYKIGVNPQTGLLDLFTETNEAPADGATQAPTE